MKVAQSYLTLCEPIVYIASQLLVHGIFQAGILSGLSFPSPVEGIIKAIYDKLTANIICNGEKLAFPLRSGAIQWCSLSSFLLNILLEVLEQLGKKVK